MARPGWRRVLAAAGIAVALVGSAAPAVATPAEEPAVPGQRSARAVFVEFARPSALDAYRAGLAGGVDLARRAATDAKAGIASLTDGLLADFRGVEGTGELFRTGNAVAGVAMRADAAAVRELAARPDVRSVRRIVPARPSNSGAVQLGRAVQAWQQTGRLGEGVRIGVVDTGIDYTHATFGGPGTRAAFDAVDPTTIDPATFPTEKVVGGIDLAGDAYDADNADPARTVPHPDPNPLDCEGHGTHVAGTAAGFGVGADGTTFRGDYAALTPDELGRMSIGPGAAPKASLYGIRVFGCTGSTDLTALALDHALDPNGDGDFADRLDVVNLSLGTAFGAVDDPVNDFVGALTAGGVLVVAAAGNAGDVYDSGGNPGNSPDALAVASVRDASLLLDGAEVPSPAGIGVVAGQYSVEYGRYGALDLRAPVVELGGPNAEGCAPYATGDAERVRGTLVWLAWADGESERACGSAPRAANAFAAGAAGVLLPSGESDFGAAIAGTADIPMFQLTGPATAAVRPALAAGNLQMRLAGALAETIQDVLPEIEDTPSAFTSRGVRGPAVKPDVAAPGQSITSAESGSGAGRLKLSGTSMASPFVAGVAAMLREEHPAWSPSQIKAAVVNTAGADVFAGENRSGPLLAPMRVGAGRIDARAALATPLLAAGAAEPGAVSVTFGTVEVPVGGGALTRRERIRVTNTGSLPAALRAAYEPVTTMPGVSYSVSPPRVVVPPGGGASVDVTLRVDDPAALRRTADPTVELVQKGRPRQYLADASGRVVLTPVDLPAGGVAVPLRVPVSAAPKPASEQEVVDREVPGGRALTLRGAGVDQGAGRQAYRSRVGVFALVASSPQLPVCAGRAVAGCVANGTGRGGDLRYVGVTSTAPAARAAGRPAEAMLGFAVSTWADLDNVGSLTQPTVEIDTTADDRPDFATTLTKLPGTDVLVARTVDLHAPLPGGAGFAEVGVEPVNGLDGDVDSNVFDTDSWVLPARLSALRIDPAATSAPIRIRVSVLGEYGPPGADDGVVDTIGRTVGFDALAPASSVRPPGDPGLTFPADDGTELSVDGDPAAPLLVLLGQNASDTRATVLGDASRVEASPDR